MLGPLLRPHFPDADSPPMLLKDFSLVSIVTLLDRIGVYRRLA